MQYYQETIALGSKTGLSLIGDMTNTQAETIYHKLWKTIFLFEKRFSRFLPNSELSMFNRNAGLKQIISTEFRDILKAAQSMSEETSGLYNPFILPALNRAGYVNSRVPGHEEDVVDDYSDKSVTSVTKLEIGDDWARIPYGTAIDLGGCGKGYLADQLRAQLPEQITGYWLSLGGDIAVGGHDENDSPWNIEVQSAYDPSSNIAALSSSADDSAVATSGTTVHAGKKAGKAWHHIIDPRTCKPAKTDILLATILDSSALRADVLASCAVILGGEEGLQFLKSRGVKAAILQLQAGNGKSKIIKFGSEVKLELSYA